MRRTYAPAQVSRFCAGTAPPLKVARRRPRGTWTSRRAPGRLLCSSTLSALLNCPIPPCFSRICPNRCLPPSPSSTAHSINQAERYFAALASEILRLSTIHSQLRRFQCRRFQVKGLILVLLTVHPPFYPSVLFFDFMNALGSFFWGNGFAAVGPIMIGSLVADREKGLRHQLQMTGLAHRACVPRAIAHQTHLLDLLSNPASHVHPQLLDRLLRPRCHIAALYVYMKQLCFPTFFQMLTHFLMFLVLLISMAATNNFPFVPGAALGPVCFLAIECVQLQSIIAIVICLFCSVFGNNQLGTRLPW